MEFIPSHVGTADTAAALELPTTMSEISALGQDMIHDLDGSESTSEGPQHPWIMSDILELGLVDRTRPMGPNNQAQLLERHHFVDA